MRTVVIALALLASSSVAFPADPPKPVSEKPLWFRVFLGTKPPKLVIAYLDESKGTGTGYDVAIVDLDGDGVPEARQQSEFGLVFYEDGREVEQSRTVPHVEVRVGELTFRLEFDSLSWDGSRVHSGRAVDWSAHSGKAMLSFRGGQLRLSPTREAAGKLPPLRIGPPFRFGAIAGTLGPDATVLMSLKDAGGFALSGCFKDGEERGPKVVLTREGAEGGSAVAEYG